MNQIFEDYKTLVLHQSNCFFSPRRELTELRIGLFFETPRRGVQRLLCFENPQPKRLVSQFLKQKTSTGVVYKKEGFKFVLHIAYPTFRKSPKGAKSTFRFAELFLKPFFVAFGETKIWLFSKLKPKFRFGLLTPLRSFGNPPWEFNADLAFARAKVWLFRSLEQKLGSVFGRAGLKNPQGGLPKLRSGNLKVLPPAVVSTDRQFCSTSCSAAKLSMGLGKEEVRPHFRLLSFAEQAKVRPADQPNEPVDRAVCSTRLAERKFLLCASGPNSARFEPKKLRIKPKSCNRGGFIIFLGRSGVPATPQVDSTATRGRRLILFRLLELFSPRRGLKSYEAEHAKVDSTAPLFGGRLINNSFRIAHSTNGVKWEKNCRNEAAPVVGFRVSIRTKLLSNSLKDKYEQSKPNGQNFRVPKVTMGQLERGIDVTPSFSATKQNKQQNLPFRKFELRKIAATEFRLPSSGVSSRSNQKILLCEFAALRSTASSSNNFKTKIWVMPLLRTNCPKMAFGFGFAHFCSLLRSKSAQSSACSAKLSKQAKVRSASQLFSPLRGLTERSSGLPFAGANRSKSSSNRNQNRKFGLLHLRKSEECLEVKTYLNSSRTKGPHFVSKDRSGVPVTPFGGSHPRATLSFFLLPLVLAPFHFCVDVVSAYYIYAKVRTFASVADSTDRLRKVSLGSTSKKRGTLLTFAAQKCACSASLSTRSFASKVYAPEFRKPSKDVLSECSCLSSKSYVRVEEKPKFSNRFTVWGVVLKTKNCRTKLLGSRKSTLSTLFWQPKRRFALSSTVLCSKTKTKYKIIRPLLHLSRESLTIICNNLWLPVYPDKSNKVVEYSRNRLREQILPAIKLFFNPKLDDALFKLAELLTQDFSLVSDLINTGRRSTSLLALNSPSRGHFAYRASLTFACKAELCTQKCAQRS